MIGVFDSGLGGLATFRALSRALPSTPLLYYADTAHLPIGERSEGEILSLTEQALRFFEARCARLALLACGTASAISLEKCKQKFTFPLFGIIKDGARAAVRLSKSGRIAVIATPATIASHAYAREIRALRPEADVTELPCPSLVKAAEAGEEGAVCEALAPLAACDADTLVLGCTHFPLLKEAIEALLPHMRTVDPAAETTARLLARLPPEGGHTPAARSFFVTGDPKDFARRATAVLGYSPTVESITL